MKDNKDKKTISLSFRIYKKLSDRIEEKAEAAKRSKSNFVINIITDALDDLDRKEKFMRQ